MEILLEMEAFDNLFFGGCDGEGEGVSRLVKEAEDSYIGEDTAVTKSILV